jgi:luciferase family oxidoreductase group 1
MKLSILDQAPISQGSTGGQALRNAVDLARFADRLGYHRYWLAEHHASTMLACASPEVLIGPIAASTAHLRVGSGGIMLPHYSPLKVAETFSMLAGLHPGRIDLGIGRAPGSDQLTAFALQRDRRAGAPDDFPQQLLELMGYYDRDLPPDHPFARFSATLAGGPETPELWLLGSSPQSGLWAAELGLPYMFADFISPKGEAIAQRYRAEFQPRHDSRGARTAIAIAAICADSDEEAWRLSASARVARLSSRAGRPIALPPVADALRILREEMGSPDAAPRGRRLIHGAPATVRQQIEEVAHAYGAEEVMVLTVVHEHDARRRSYALIAEAFGLPQNNAGSAPAG